MIRPISLLSNDKKEIELAINKLVREITTSTPATSKIAYADKPDSTKGEKGDKGDKGDSGGIGPRGPQGLQGIQGPIGGSLGESFESTLTNLNGYNYTFTRDINGKITKKTFSLGGSSIVVTYNRTAGKLTSIVLSGDTPDGIDLTKTIAYSSGKISGASYT
jgi:hypothetical protein